MKLGLINSAWVQAGQGTAYGIWKTREIGFDSIDIFADPLDLNGQERALIRRECAAAGLPIISVACVAVGLVDFNPSVQRFHLDRVSAFLDMAQEFQARNLLLVLGEYIWQKEVIPPQDQWATAIKHVRTLGERATALGLEIALELEPFQLSLLNDVPSMLRFLTEVDQPAVKANLDISHLALAHQSPSSIETLRGRVAHVHISDCDGKVHGDLPPGRGVVDFAPYLQAIKRLGIDDATISVELEYSPDPEHIVEWVTEAHDQTALLLRASRTATMSRVSRCLQRCCLRRCSYSLAGRWQRRSWKRRGRRGGWTSYSFRWGSTIGRSGLVVCGASSPNRPRGPLWIPQRPHRFWATQGAWRGRPDWPSRRLSSWR